MKKFIQTIKGFFAIAIVMLSLFLAGCSMPTAVEQIQEIKKPAIVFSKHEARYWSDSYELTLVDADGKMVEIDGINKAQLCERYNVGDTIKAETHFDK